ncbi:LPD23 domain-containing protein [Bdellovibrio bacteriovorus]
MDLNQDQLNELSNELYNQQPQDDGPDYEEALKSHVEGEASQLRQSMYVATQRDPDQYTRHNKIAQKYGVSPSFAAENSAELERKSKLNEIDYEGLVKSNPKLTEFLKDPENATLAQDDLDNLKKIDSIVNEPSFVGELFDSIAYGAVNLVSSLAKSPALAHDRAAGLPVGMEDYQYQIKNSIPEFEKGIPKELYDNKVTQYLDAKAQSLAPKDIDADVLKEATNGNYTKAIRGLTLQIASNLPQLGLVAATRGAGLPILALSSASEKFADNLEKGIDPEVAKSNALLTGGIEAGIESIGGIGGNPLKNSITQIVKSLGPATAKDIIQASVKNIVKTSGEEGIEEFVTSVTHDLLDYSQDVNPNALDGIWHRGVNSLLVGIGSGGVTQTISTTPMAALEIQQRKNKQIEDVQTYNALGEAIQQSNLGKRSPEKLKQVVGQLTVGTPIETVYMPVEGVDEYFQSKGINPTKFMSDSGLLKEYQAAKETGGNVELPLSTWVEKVGQTEHFRGLENNIKFNQDALTKNEEHRENSRIKGLYEQAEADALAKLNDPATKEQQEKIESDMNQIRARLADQLKSTGRYTDQMINDQVELMARPMRYFAAAHNVSPVELLNSMNLKIQAGDVYKSKTQRAAESIANDVDSALELYSKMQEQQPQNIPSFDAEGNRIFDTGVLGALKRSIETGSAGEQGAKVDESGNQTGSWGVASTFPEFFKNKGYTKKETLKILEKQSKGEKLTDKQKGILEDLYAAALEKTNRGEFFQFAGQQSQAAPIPQLQKANQMFEAGTDIETIRKETGWFMGPDKRWRYEISDKNAKLKIVKFGSGKRYKLADILEHEELFNAYPGLREMQVVLGIARGKRAGSYSRATKTLEVLVDRKFPDGVLESEQAEFANIKQTPEFKEFSEKYWATNSKEVKRSLYRAWKETELGKRYDELMREFDKVKKVSPKTLPEAELNTVLHEIQHAIQHIEGFANGAKMGRSVYGKEKYWNTLGEVEARNVESRKNLSDAERQELTPDSLTWKNPIINWGSVTEELPIASPQELQNIKIGEQLRLFQSQNGKFTVRQDMPKEVKILKVQDENISIEEAKQFALDNLRGLVVRENGGKIEVAKKGIEETAFKTNEMQINLEDNNGKTDSTPEEIHASTIALKYIDQLLESAVFDAHEPVRKQKQGLVAFKRYYAPIQIGGKDYIVRIKTQKSEVKSQPESFYIEVAVENENPTGTTGKDSKVTEHSTADSGASTIKIGDFAQLINNIRSNRSWFQDEQNPRAVVNFDKYGISIDLFKGADPTSLMHEMGHVYLELFRKSSQLENAPAWLKDDSKKVLNYLGIDSFDKIETEHHEKWAKSIELYLYEGKVPSDELSSVMARMKMWFRKIYIDAKAALGVELNPEITEVMDRVFAGDHLLEKAENQYKPLIDDAIIKTMTTEEQAKYLKTLEKYKIKATQSVTEKLMESHTKERRKWWKNETLKIQELFRHELAKKREYVAQNFIKTGALPGQEKLTDPRAHKLSRESLKQVFGNVPEWANRSMIAKEGADVTFISDLLGFKDVHQFNEEMSKLEDIDALSLRMAEEQMKKDYGDTFSDMEKLQEVVENAVHNDKRGEILRKELEFLASEDLATLKGLIRKIARRPPKDKLMQTKAERIISEKSIGEIRPFIYQRAEVKAAREAAEYFTKGDFEKAFDAKQRELLNYYLYRESVRAKEMINDKIDWSKKVFEKSAQDQADKRDWSMVSVARVLLGEFGVTQRDFKSATDYLEQIQKYDEDTFEGLKPLVSKWLMDKKDYRKLSVQEFSEFFEDVEAIWSLSKSSRELEIAGVKHDLDEVSEKLTNRLTEITTKPYAPGVNKAVTDADRRIDKFMSFKSSMQRVESWVDLVDSGDPNKLFETFILNPVREAVVNYKLKKADLLNKYKELVEKMPKSSLEHKDILATEINYTFKDKAELLAALLHTGNDSNLFKLLAGRKWGDVDEDTATVDPSRWNRFIDRMHREQIITKADWDFIQGIWDLNESIKTDSQKAHKEMYGHYFDEITHKKLVTPFGEYRGGYMPAVTDSFLVEDQRIRQEQDALLNNNNSFMFPTTGRGFTKARVAQYNAPLLLDMNMVAGHFDKVLRFTYIEPTIKKVAKVNNKKDYRAVLREYDPYAGTNLLNPWLQRSAQQRVVQPSQSPTYQKFDGVAKFIRSSAGLQILGGNLSNAMQQLTGTLVASSKVHPKYLVKALGNYAIQPNVTKEEVMDLSPWMRTRLGEGTIKINDDINQILFNPSKFEQASDYAKRNGMILSEMFQAVVDISVWQGAYSEALDQGMTKAQAIKRADKEVRLTQGSANAEDISSVEEGTHWSRLFTQFYGYFNMQGNLIGTETAKKVRQVGWYQALPTLLPFYLSSYLLPGLAAQAIAQMMSGKNWDSDGDDEIIDDLAWMTLTSTYKGLFALIPMVGQAANMLIGQFTDDRFDDRLSLSPALQAIENVGRTAFVTYKAASGEDLKGNEIKSMLSTLGFTTGLPMGPLGKPIGYMMDVKSGEAEPSGPIDFARGLATGKAGEP